MESQSNLNSDSKKMSISESSTSQEIVTTSFLLSNLHCPSCVSHIKDIFAVLQPPPSFTPWLATSWVTVSHSKSLSVSEIRNVLEDGGFDVCDVSPDAPGELPIRHGEIGYLDRIMDKWTSSSHENKSNNSKHLENCEQCRQEAKLRDGTASSSSNISLKGQGGSTMDIEKGLPLVVVDSTDTQDIWRATLAVGGMTCAACVGAITEALEKKSWIRKVVVNLIGNSATVDFDGQHRDELVEIFEDIGYDVTIDNIISLQPQLIQSSSIASRTVEIKVDGMFCGHCPPRVLASLETFGDRIKIEKPLTIQDPILKISYIPQVPDFTIRNILASIKEADEALVPSIYHPPTLEERSRKIHAHERKRLLVRVIFTLVISIPTLVVGIVLMSLVSENNIGRRYFMTHLAGGISRGQWALFALATPVWFLCADVFHIRALKEVRALWRPSSSTPILRRFYRFGSMNMLMSLGTSIAYISSVAQLVAAGASSKGSHPNDDSFYFDSVVFLTLFLLVGRLIEAYSKSKTGDAVMMLGKLRPSEALLIESKLISTMEHATSDEEGAVPKEQEVITRQDVVTSISVDLLEFGDVVRVLNGGSPPCDGTIIEGRTKFDESSLTGESRLVKKISGDEVFSGSVNKESTISIKITGIAGASMLDQIVKAVREGQTQRAPIERIADSLTAYFVPLVTLIAISTWIIWLSLGYSGTLSLNYRGNYAGGWAAWSLQFAIAVFVVACPCGLALAAPTALFVGGGLAAQHGILAKGGGEAFEKASKLDCIVFDKTGTLTCGGNPIVTDHHVFIADPEQRDPRFDGISRCILGLISSIERHSSHTIAKALADFCKDGTIDLFELENVEELAGKGLVGNFRMGAQEGSLIIGNELLMEDHSVNIHAGAHEFLESWKSSGKSVALAAVNLNGKAQHQKEEASWHLMAGFAIADQIRPEAPAIVRALQQRKMDVWMLSGDNITTARAIGLQVGILPSNIIADVLPAAKAETIRYLQKTLKARTGSGSEHNQKRALVAMVGDGINDAPALTAADIGIAIGSGSDIAISSAMFVLVSSNLNSLVTLLDLSKIVFRRIKFNFAWALVYNMIALPVAAGAFYPIVSNGSHVRLAPVWASLAMAASSISVVLSSLALRSNIPGVGFRVQKEASDLGREDTGNEDER